MNNESGQPDKAALAYIDSLLKSGVIRRSDLRGLLEDDKRGSGERVRDDLEAWFRHAGMGLFVEGAFSLLKCPFSDQEIEKAEASGRMVLCVPRRISRQNLGRLFHLESWALSDGLVGRSGGRDLDDWFITDASPTPPHVNLSPKEALQLFDEQHVYGFSIERYLVFIARYRLLNGTYPDYRWWTWLLSHKYDQSAYLIAGFDPNGVFSIHGWRKTFQADFVGARWVNLPETV